MAEQEKDRNLDLLLDSLLDSYSDVEPRPGLETRVIANLRDQAGKKKSWLWRWAWIWAGSATAAVAALVFIIVLSERPIEPPRPPVAYVVSPSVDRSASAVTQRLYVAKKAIQPRHQEPVVAVVDRRPDRFPTPAPLSDQEKLLLRYLARTSRQEIIAQSHPDEPAEMPEPF
ncbi:MAG TPA: hypothetical protein VG759_17535 [Candidatus Angelobacter sp.]|jgi:hypothetical protein|nr:hypothetical protein [Candidatus Angelobacter sp.]